MRAGSWTGDLMHRLKGLGFGSTDTPLLDVLADRAATVLGRSFNQTRDEVAQQMFEVTMHVHEFERQQRELEALLRRAEDVAAHPLPDDTRLRFAKQAVLSVLRVYTRSQADLNRAFVGSTLSLCRTLVAATAAWAAEVGRLEARVSKLEQEREERLRSAAR